MDLDALLAEALGPAGVPPGEDTVSTSPVRTSNGSLPPVGAIPIKKVSYTHAAMADVLIANPAISQNALAAKFGYTPAWISNILASDSFQSFFAERIKTVVDPVLMLTVEERFKGLVLRSQEILAEKLSKPTDSISDQLVVRTLELSSRALGYGAKDPDQTPKVHVEVHLEDLGTRLEGLLRKKRAEATVIDVETAQGV